MRFKAEWEKQSAILLAFPHKNSDWARYIDEARACFLNIIKIITKFENIVICVDYRDKKGFEILKQSFAPNCDFKFQDSNLHVLKLTNRITLAFMPTNDTWARDFGAITLESNTYSSKDSSLDFSPESNADSSQAETNENLTLLDFSFNGWGNKFSANFDNQITQNLCKLGLLSQNLKSFDFVLEGGSIDTNGKGLLLTTAQCLLEPNRNPQFSKPQIETFLKAQLHIKKVLWLDSGFLQGDDTDSHIDTLARFIDANTIAYITCDDESDIHYNALKKMEQELQSLTDSNNKPFKLIKLPFTRAIYYDNERLPASYANFLFINDALLVPTYNDENDALALEILKKACPDREVIGIDCSVLIRQHGSLHCVTMQLY